MGPYRSSPPTANVVVVVGGGSGIGRAIACAVASTGAHVIVAGRRADALQGTRDIAPGDIECEELDVTDSAQVDSVIDNVAARWGRIDGLVNAAGRTSITPSDQISDREFTNVLSVNVVGAMALSRAVARTMLPAGAGSIVHVGSLTAHRGLPNRVAYTCSKHALLGLVRTLGAEWGGRGVRVNLLSPGWISTEMTNQAVDAGHLGKAGIVRRTPAGRWGAPKDVVGGALFLLGAGSTFVTGSELVIDGGWSCVLDDGLSG